MKVIIFGMGSIGKRHAQILLKGFDHELYAFRSSKNSGKNDLGIKELFSWEEVEKLSPDIAIIANPTFPHVKTAIKCAELGMHLFIEKPLSHSYKDVEKLKKLCKRKKLTCYTAYCLRFHPVIIKLKELLKDKKVLHARIVCASYLPDWRNNGKLNYSAFKRQVGGVLLDLSHEFDYAQHLFGKIEKMDGVFGKTSGVTVDSEDFADVLISTDKKVPVNVHLNYFGRFSERSIVVDLKDGYILADLLKGTVEVVSKGKKRKLSFVAERDVYLKEQMKYFFRNIGNKKMMNGIDEAGELLTKILELKK